MCSVADVMPGTAVGAAGAAGGPAKDTSKCWKA